MRKTSLSWPRVTISTDEQTAVAVAPSVISASRATDIPALYGEWLVQQFKKGYTCWKNPFNGMVQHIALDATEVIAFWSKNPQPFMRQLVYFDKRNIGYFFQFTLNNYEEERFEPGLPPLATRINTLKTLADTIGKQRVLWRFDPVIITPEVAPHAILDKIEAVGNQIAHCVDRLTVSFLSHYPRVIRNLLRYDVHPCERTDEIINEIGEGLARFSKEWGIRIYTCAEEADMSRFGIMAGSCIDPVYIANVFGAAHPRISAFLHDAMPLPLFPSEEKLIEAVKDPGQRPRCRCMVSKDIGAYGTCTLGCTYCYAGGRYAPP